MPTNALPEVLAAIVGSGTLMLAAGYLGYRAGNRRAPTAIGPITSSPVAITVTAKPLVLEVSAAPVVLSVRAPEVAIPVSFSVTSPPSIPLEITHEPVRLSIAPPEPIALTVKDPPPITVKTQAGFMAPKPAVEPATCNGSQHVLPHVGCHLDGLF